MADAGWTALGGVAVGVFGTMVSNWWLARGKVRADQDARAEARREKRAERRDDLQRQTLLELQEVVINVARIHAKGRLLTIEAMRNAPGTPWRRAEWPTELEEESRATRARMGVLKSRVIDDACRELATRFAMAGFAETVASNPAEAYEAHTQLQETFQELQDQAGQLIRQMDDP